MPRFALALFLAQLTATLFMTGLIWFVQIVHYPLFQELPPNRFPRYVALHGTRTSFVVGPPMLVELLTSLLALIPALRPAFFTAPAALASAALVFVLWAATGCIQVPLHNALGRAHDPARIRRLVLSNWIRTAAWTARSTLLLTILIGSLRPNL